MILRHHGGAALPSSSVNTSRTTENRPRPRKERIARKVASEIPDGATLFIDIGTTPEAVAHALLNHNDLRIVTNNLNVANTLMVKRTSALSRPAASCAAGMAVLSVRPPRTLSPSFALISAFSASAVSTAMARCWSLTTTKCAPNGRLLKTPAT